MLRDNELQLGFSPEDTTKALQVLSKLIPYVIPENLVLVGGLARTHHLLRRGVSFLQRPFNDLDLMIKDSTDLNPSVTDEFLIAHYHLRRYPHYHLPKNTSFFTELVDPQTRVVIDVFDYYHNPVYPEEVQVSGLTLKVRSAEDQLTKTAYDLMKITKGNNLYPKEFDSADQLLQIVDLEKADAIWRMKYASLYPFPLAEAIHRAKEEATRHPERVFEFHNRRIKPFVCLECTEVPGFSIAPKEDIIKVLGYAYKI